MDTRVKTLIIFVLIGVVIGGAFLFTSENENLYKGFIGEESETGEENDENVIAPVSEQGTPDLTVSLNLVVPENNEEDIVANSTISNIGSGAVSKDDIFSYTITVNDTEVFTHSDKYSEMAAGDSFNFAYPIPKTIYNYPDTGTVTLSVDSEGRVNEINEENNTTTMEYSY